MSAQLSPCPNCSRHVRVNEASCPFCKVSLVIDGYTNNPGYLREHVAAVFVGVTLAISGCTARKEEGPKEPKPPTTEPISSPVALYGAPAPTTQPTTTPSDPGVGSPKPMYGLPPNKR